MNKEMADMFEKTPQEIKEKGFKLNQAIRRMRKAAEQAKLWNDEYKIAERERCLCEEDYGQASLRWDIENGTMKPLEELTK